VCPFAGSSRATGSGQRPPHWRRNADPAVLPCACTLEQVWWPSADHLLKPEARVVESSLPRKSEERLNSQSGPVLGWIDTTHRHFYQPLHAHLFFPFFLSPVRNLVLHGAHGFSLKWRT
jgi:hypothetical protein